MSLKKTFGSTMLKLLGFKIVGEVPKVPKYVLMIAPHTSIIDVFYGKCYNWAIEMIPHIIVKKEFFFFPLGAIIRGWGGVPIDRKKGKNVMEQMVNYFDCNEKFILAITPEGTRARNPNWKSGFYRIAVAANVPIYMCFIDFKKKEVGFIGEFKPTDNLKKDIKAIKYLYKDMEGFHKDKFTVGKI